MQFKEYAPKPIVREAFPITADMKITWVPETKRATVDNGSSTQTFTSTVKPKHGDFVCKSSAGNIYHSPREVFLERNVVEALRFRGRDLRGIEEGLV
tara:strand:- start:642 stop:932 length:291 start_codon:yes stop_codon:yes gene_type:complete